MEQVFILQMRNWLRVELYKILQVEPGPVGFVPSSPSPYTCV